MNQAAQLQIRRLYVHSGPVERKKLAKYLKPLPAAIEPKQRHNEPIRIGQILPGVFDNICNRIGRAKAVK